MAAKKGRGLLMVYTDVPATSILLYDVQGRHSQSYR